MPSWFGQSSCRSSAGGGVSTGDVGFITVPATARGFAPSVAAVMGGSKSAFMGVAAGTGKVIVARAGALPVTLSVVGAIAIPIHDANASELPSSASCVTPSIDAKQWLVPVFGRGDALAATG